MREEPLHIVDTSGLICPLPLLKLKKALRDVPAGKLVRFITTDASTASDMTHFCTVTSMDVVESSLPAEGEFHFLLRAKAL